MKHVAEQFEFPFVKILTASPRRVALEKLIHNWYEGINMSQVLQDYYNEQYIRDSFAKITGFCVDIKKS